MAMTEKQKAACLKYQKKQSQISIRLKPEDLAKYKAAAQRAGISCRSWVLASMDSALCKEEL